MSLVFSAKTIQTSTDNAAANATWIQTIGSCWSGRSGRSISSSIVEKGRIVADVMTMILVNGWFGDAVKSFSQSEAMPICVCLCTANIL